MGHLKEKKICKNKKVPKFQNDSKTDLINLRMFQENLKKTFQMFYNLMIE